MSKWNHESAKIMGAALWSVRQTRSAPSMICGITGKEIPTDRPWCLFLGYDAVHPSAEGDAPELLQVAVAELNKRGIRDDDELQVGLTLPEYFVSDYCPMQAGKYVYVGKRALDAACGLTQGNKVHGLSPEALHKMSPTLERYLCDRFGTEPWQPPAPPEPPSAEQVAIAERAARQTQATINAARALVGTMKPNTEDVGRAVVLLQAVVDYLAAL